jgi:FkbM family methyltransferase
MDAAQTLVGRRGLMLTRWPPEGTLERETKRVLVDRKIDTVIDVGAHEGRYANTLRRLGFRGRIVSVEPSPAPYRRLAAAACSDRYWDVVDAALGDRESRATLREYNEHEEFSSVHSPSEYGRRYGLTVRRTVEVQVRTLDKLVSDVGVDPASCLVKVDTQGHDLAVLEGGGETLAVARALQVEIPMFGLYEGSPSGTRLIDRVRELGFDLVGMFPVHAHPRPLVPVEFDGLFARGADVG